VNGRVPPTVFDFNGPPIPRIPNPEYNWNVHRNLSQP